MITAFVGDNGPAREQAAKEYIGGFIGVHGITAINRFNGDATDLVVLKDSVATVAFLSTKRMVVVRDLSSNKNLSDNFEEIIRSVADSTELVIIENHIDNRSKYLTQLKKIAVVKEFTHLEGEELIKWVIDQAEALKGKISHQDAQFLVDRVGTNHYTLVNELAKLVLYSSEITPESIRLLTTYSPQSSVFAMLDAAFGNQTSKALQLYDEQKSQGMEPQAILGMIAWQLHVLAVVKSAGNANLQTIASESKLNPFVIRKNMQLAKNISMRKILQMLNDAIAADRMLKSTSAHADDVLQTLIISFN